MPRLVDHVGDTLATVRVVLGLLAEDELEEAFARLEELEAKLESVHYWFGVGQARSGEAR